MIASRSIFTARARPARGVAAVAACCLAGLSACDDGTSSSTDVVYTEVYVEPTSFRGEVPCSALPGGMRSFVATLIDVSAKGADADPALRTTLASSLPAPCTTRVGFATVTAGRSYVGEIDGFDRDVCQPNDKPPGCIVPLGSTAGGPATGARVMIEEATGAIVAPRWTTSCGDPTIAPSTHPTSFDAPTESLYLTAVPLRSCRPMALGTGSGSIVATNLRLDGAAILGGLTCGAEPAQVDRLEVTTTLVGDPAGGGSTPAPLACGQPLVIEDLLPARSYLVNVLAYESGATVARWGTTCSATTSGGLTVPMACEPLRQDGALIVPSAPLLTAAGAGCTPNGDAPVIARLEGTLVGVAARTEGACAADLRFSGLPAGSYSAVVAAFKADGTQAFQTLCRGEIVPGRESTALCDPL